MVSSAALVSLMLIAGCSNAADDAATPAPENSAAQDEVPEDGQDVVPMPQVSAIPVPTELSALTGIAWNEASGHLVAVSASGQIASLDGDSLAPVDVIESGTDALSDITVDTDGLLAVAPTGERLTIAITAAGEVQVTDTEPTTLDFEPRGVVFSPDVDGPLVSADSAAGPSVRALDGATVAEELQLNDPTMPASSALAAINGQFLASDADAPTVTIFDERGDSGARLGAEGMSSIEGITNRDGTFVFAGTDRSGEAVIATYNLTDGQEIDPDPAAGPATLTETLTATESLVLPGRLTQPSGIAYDKESDSMLINTDQGEFFALTPDLSDVRFTFDVPGFNQGNIEDVQVTGPGQAAMVVEDASYVPFRYDGTNWVAGERVVVDALDTDVSAIGFDEAAGQLVFIAEDGPDKTLIATTPDGDFVRETDIDTSAVGIENLDDYTIAGISYHKGLFYVLSEQYSTVFSMTPEGVVTAAFGLADVEEPSGLTVHDGSIWAVLDHEDSEPAPPVLRYPLPPRS